MSPLLVQAVDSNKHSCTFLSRLNALSLWMNVVSVLMINKVCMKWPSTVIIRVSYVLDIAHAQLFHCGSTSAVGKCDGSLNEKVICNKSLFILSASFPSQRQSEDIVENGRECAYECVYFVLGVFLHLFDLTSLRSFPPQRDPGFNQIWPNRFIQPKVENVRLCKVRLHAGTGELKFESVGVLSVLCECNAVDNVTVKSGRASGWTWLQLAGKGICRLGRPGS